MSTLPILGIALLLTVFFRNDGEGNSLWWCMFDHSHQLTPKEKELWMLFDRVYVTELLARDAFAKGAYMLGAEDREIMLR